MKGNFKGNKYLFIGALFAGIYYLNRVFHFLPSFVAGFLLGIALVGFGVGVYQLNQEKRNKVK